MAGLDDIVGLFFDEADQLLGELEEALLELEVNPDDPELVALVFRVLHTLKGAGAMYGFERVSECAHTVETLFDQVRKGTRALDSEVVAIGLRARDVLNALVVDRESAVVCAEACELRDHIERLLDERLTRLPVSDSTRPDETTGGLHGFHIEIHPRLDAYRRGLRIVSMLEEILSFGDAEVTCDISRVPPIEDLNTEDCFFSWSIDLSTERCANDIAEAVMFLDEEEWSIVESADDSIPLSDCPSSPAGKRRPPGTPAERQGSQTKKASGLRSLRVPAERLDEIVDLIGELVTVQAALAEVATRGGDPLVAEMSERVERISNSLRSSVLTIRMVPVGSLFSRFRRHVRDLAEELGKQVVVEIDGGETELDKSLIDRIEEPLLHLVRNCLSHGIETPEVRAGKGKPETGRVMLSAFHAGGNVYLRVRDDGAGIDLERVQARAVDAGLAEAGAEITAAQAKEFLTTPGFSTALEVTNVAGRGVGLDVVKRTVEDLQGSLQLDIADDGGLATTMRLPLTLAVVEGLLVSVGDERYLLPLALVEECVELAQQSGWAQHGRDFLKMRDELIPFVRLRDVFDVPGAAPTDELAVVVRSGDLRFGIVVDTVIDRLQTVIKMLGRAIRKAEGVSGATVLGDGSIALIVDIAQVAAAARAISETREAG